MDRLTAEQRSQLMSRVRGKDTGPEKIVRSLVHRLGFRFRLHSQELPGRPDLIFPRLRKIIFVHGCFWHGHSCRSGRTRPASNSDYWNEKLDRNKQRDRSAKRKLRRLGWDVLVLWGCQLKNGAALEERLSEFLGARQR